MHVSNNDLTSKLILDKNTIVCVRERERRGVAWQPTRLDENDDTVGASDNEDDEIEVSSEICRTL